MRTALSQSSFLSLPSSLPLLPLPSLYPILPPSPSSLLFIPILSSLSLSLSLFSPHLHLPPAFVVAICQFLHLLSSLKHISQAGATDTSDRHWERFLHNVHLLISSIARPTFLRLLCNLHKVREIRLKVFSLECAVQPLPPLEPVLVISILDTSWSNQRLKTSEELLCVRECEMAHVLNQYAMITYMYIKDLCNEDWRATCLLTPTSLLDSNKNTMISSASRQYVV